MNNKLIFNNRDDKIDNKIDNKNVETGKIKKEPRSELNPKQLTQELESPTSALRMAAVENLSGNIDALKYVAEYSYYEDTRAAANNEINKLNRDLWSIKDLVDILMKTQI